MTSLRIVTINTGKGDGPYHRRMRLLIEQLAVLQPDVIALQESFRSEDVCADTAGVVARALRLQLFYAPARRKERVFGDSTAWSESGLALLSRGPWRATEIVELPSDPRDGQRLAQVATLELDGTTLTFANLHLTHLGDADELRRCQLEALLGVPLIAQAPGPVLLGGDFNTTAGGPVLGPLLAGDPRFVVRDAWVAGDGAAERGTIASRGENGPCVDHILSLAKRSGDHPQFHGSALALTTSDSDGTLPSDHFGVTTCLDFDSPTMEAQ